MKAKLMYSLNVLGVECKLLGFEGKKKRKYQSFFRYPKNLAGEVKIIIYEDESFRGAISRFTLEIRNMYEEHIPVCNIPYLFNYAN